MRKEEAIYVWRGWLLNRHPRSVRKYCAVEALPLYPPGKAKACPVLRHGVMCRPAHTETLMPLSPPGNVPQQSRPAVPGNMPALPASVTPPLSRCVHSLLWSHNAMISSIYAIVDIIALIRSNSMNDRYIKRLGG